MPSSPALTRALRARRVILSDPHLGGMYARLTAQQRRVIDNLLETGRFREARREIVRQDEIRRLRRRLRDQERLFARAVAHVLVLYGDFASPERVEDNLSFATDAELRRIPSMTLMQYSMAARRPPVEREGAIVNPFWYH